MLNLTVNVKIKTLIAFPTTIKVINELDAVANSFGVERANEEKSIDFKSRFVSTANAGLSKANNAKISFAKELGLLSDFILIEHTEPENKIYKVEIDNSKYLIITEYTRRSVSSNLFNKQKTVLDLLDKITWPNLSEVCQFISQSFALSVTSLNKKDQTINQTETFSLLEGQSNIAQEGYFLNFGRKVLTKGYPVPKTVSFREYLGRELTEKTIQSEVLTVNEFYADYWGRYIYHLGGGLSKNQYSVSFQSIQPYCFLHYIKGINQIDIDLNSLNRKLIAEEDEYFSVRRSTKSETFEIKKISGIVESNLINNLLEIDTRKEWNSNYRWS